jgi:hypothetical protein
MSRSAFSSPFLSASFMSLGTAGEGGDQTAPASMADRRGSIYRGA